MSQDIKRINRYDWLRPVRSISFSTALRTTFPVHFPLWMSCVFRRIMIRQGNNQYSRRRFLVCQVSLVRVPQPDTLINGVTGLTIRPRDHVQLASAIKEPRDRSR